MASHIPLEEVLISCPRPQQQQQQQQQQNNNNNNNNNQERKVRPHPDQALKCPRCDSTNTKFCYYNNYSLSQPRYFCKGCRRYWTQGGSLRNVPVGGGCRKKKISSFSSSSSSAAAAPSSSSSFPSPSSSSSSSFKKDLVTTNPNPLLPTSLVAPPLPYDPIDLSLTFARPMRSLGFDDHDSSFLLGNPNPSTTNLGISTVPASAANDGFLDILRGGFLGNNYPSGFPNNHPYYGFGGGGGNNGSVKMEGGVSGWGEEGMVLPFEGGENNNMDGVAQTVGESCHGSNCHKAMLEGGESKAVMGLQWEMTTGDGNNNNNNNNTNNNNNNNMVVVESAGRDYWNNINGVGPAATSWHGLINSSLI